jgi:hypothetical protein
MAAGLPFSKPCPHARMWVEFVRQFVWGLDSQGLLQPPDDLLDPQGVRTAGSALKRRHRSDEGGVSINCT